MLPPPTASHVQGNARNGRSRTMSIAMNTIVPHNPMAAALAIPCVVREPAKNPGKNAAATPPASTTTVSSSDAAIPGDSSRATKR